jgi:hypothetical protein
MAGITLTWALEHHGWALCVVADEHAEAEAIVSYVTGGPEQLLNAVARLVHGADETRAEFEAEPDVYRWIFRRTGGEATIRLLHVPDHALPYEAGETIWSSRQPVDTLARVVIRAFDAVATAHGEAGYEAAWGRAFPRFDLDALRSAWAHFAQRNSESTGRAQILGRLKQPGSRRTGWAAREHVRYAASRSLRLRLVVGRRRGRPATAVTDPRFRGAGTDPALRADP